MFIICIDGSQEYVVSEALYDQLTERNLVEPCDECSSSFSARLVAHPISEDDQDTVRRLILSKTDEEPTT